MTRKDGVVLYDSQFHQIPLQKLEFSDILAEIQRRIFEDSMLQNHSKNFDELFDKHCDDVFIEVLERFVCEHRR